MLFKKGRILLASCLLVASSSSVAYQNGVWVYDALFDDKGNKIGVSPGLHAAAIVNYIQSANPYHKITEIYAYGGNLKMYCQGSGGSSSTTPCDATTLKVAYEMASSNAYYNAVRNLVPTVNIEPIVDGVIGGTFLKNFNTLDEKSAVLYADLVAARYCADNNINGIEFDLEPFDITQPGQAAFYKQVAKNLAGKHNETGPDPFSCANTLHPNGRSFAVFATASRINADLANILNKYHNGYLIGPLYSLIKYTGTATPPSVYQVYANNEVKRMVSRAKTYNIKYQFGIPAAATIQEFESINNIPSGYKQLDYVKAAINSINTYARTDINFIGINLFAWNSRRIRNGNEFKPAMPPTEVLEYLKENL